MRNLGLAHVAVVIGAAATLLTVVVAQQGVHDDVDGYFSWTRLNAQRNFIESPHPTPKDVYVNEIGLETVAQMAFPFPDGTVIVKEVVNEETLAIEMLPSMRKVAGFDPERNDWQYAMFERQDDGSLVGEWVEVGTDMHAMCSDCHAQAAETDFAFLGYLGD